MNNAILVGRLVRKPEKDDKYVRCTLAVNRQYKNEEGIYETDFIDIRVYKYLGQSLCDYCKAGDLIGVKGRIETENIESDDIKRKITYIIADKITFLSMARKEEEA